ncbi:MAG: branched-chain amino acid ABC transporter permease [Deferrisomatales bacterium]
MQKRNGVLKIAGAAAGLAVLCAVPWGIGEYYVEILILFMINLILAVSYRLVTTTGDWSLCHVVLYGAGAYASAMMTKFLGLSVWLAMPVAGVVAAAVGLGFIYPLLRTKGFGFFIASYAMGEFLRLIWIKFHNPFGGPRGMISIPTPELGTIDFFFATPYYYLTLIVTVVSLVVMYRLDRSRIGDVWKAVYADELLSECVGIRVPRYRTFAFVTGAFFAGIAGALLAHRLGAIDPHNFDVTTMVYLIIWVVVGGTATFWGPIIGLAVMTLVFESTRPLLEWRPLLFGAILILTLLFMPDGLEGLMARVAGALKRKRPAPAAAGVARDPQEAAGS